MKTIRNQVNYPKKLQLPVPILKGSKTCPYSNFSAAIKNKKKDKEKFN